MMKCYKVPMRYDTRMVWGREPGKTPLLLRRKSHIIIKANGWAYWCGIV